MKWLMGKFMTFSILISILAMGTFVIELLLKSIILVNEIFNVASLSYSHLLANMSEISRLSAKDTSHACKLFEFIRGFLIFLCIHTIVWALVTHGAIFQCYLYFQKSFRIFKFSAWIWTSTVYKSKCTYSTIRKFYLLKR